MSSHPDHSDPANGDHGAARDEAYDHPGRQRLRREGAGGGEYPGGVLTDLGYPHPGVGRLTKDQATVGGSGHCAVAFSLPLSVDAFGICGGITFFRAEAYHEDLVIAGADDVKRNTNGGGFLLVSCCGS